MSKIFFAKCEFPTATIEKGKEYEVLDENDNIITIKNDKGNKISLIRDRFSVVRAEDNSPKEEASKIICKTTGKFKSITVGNKYTIEKESKDFYYIINDLGKQSRYGKKYFQIAKKYVPKEKAKVLKAVCYFPIEGETTFKKAYDFKEGGQVKADFISIKNDKGVTSLYLKKRFKLEKV